MNTTILAPVMALVLWSLVMWLWLYATRLPAMVKAKIKLDPTQPKEALTGALPPHVRWKADNYNHLMEQPTIFYATALVAAVGGVADQTAILLAWTYVGLRLLHSLIQATVNIIMLRFLIFTVATVVLGVLAVRTALAIV